MTKRSISPYERYGEVKPIENSVLIQHIFVAGETLSGLAQKYYEDWRLWGLIAKRNNIADVRQIEPGTALFIPEMPMEFRTGNFEID